MSQTNEIRIKVTPDELVSISNEVESQIESMKRQFEKIDEIISTSNSYWTGDGQIAYVQSFHAENDAIQDVLKKFSNNVTMLRTIAGVYTATEAKAIETANTLSCDVIV